MKRCPRCGQTKPASQFYLNKARRDGLSPYCAACQNEATLESARALRDRAFAHLGGKCQRCGYDSDPRAFQIDHIEGDGAIERSTGKLGGQIYRAVLRDDGSHYALLCANCNQIKRIEMAEHRGARVYARAVPTERIERPSRRWTPERRAAQSARSQAQWDDPAYRAKMILRNSEVMTARWASGEKPNRPRDAEAPQ